MSYESAPSQSRGQMGEDQLLTLIAQYERASLGSQVAAGGTVSSTVAPASFGMTTLEVDRYNALNAYFARPLGNEIENRSQVVLPEVRDTIEWIMPQLMRMFAAAKTICRFDPENPQDEQQAEVETAVINHIFLQQNNGFVVLHDFFKDALLMKNGYAEVYAKQEQKVSEEHYTGLSEIELTSLLNAEGVEVIGQKETQTQISLNPGQPPIPISSFEVTLRKQTKEVHVCVTCLPPEEMRITPRAREGMEDLAFAMHLTTCTRSDLLSEGYDEAWVESCVAGRPNWLEMDALARNTNTDQLSVENPADRSMQEIELRKVIIRVDFDGDGIAELRRILIGGDKIGDNEIIEETPFASCAPIRMPHRHTGISIYDLIMDLQVLKTELWRQGLDNLKISNNQRVAVDWRNCNFDDLLSSRPGGVVRGNGPPQAWIMPLEQPSNIVQQVLPTMQYLDDQKQQRTGVGRTSQGLDADELQDVTKGAMLAQMSAASLKIELIARLLAEGVKDIFRKIHAEFIRHQDQPLEMEIAGKWVNIDPSTWRKRTRVTVNVGLGSGNREELRANTQLLAQAQTALAQMGLVGPKQAYETFKTLCDALGFQNPERFAMDPSSQEYQQHLQQMQQMQASAPPAPQVQVAQIKAQSSAQQQQMTNQREVLKLQGQLAQSQIDNATDHLKFQQQLAHDGMQGAHDRGVQTEAMHAQILQTIIKALSPIIAQQLKNDAAANAGEVLRKDVDGTGNLQ